MGWKNRLEKKAWTHKPISIEYSEDFWISAVLKSFYNISIKTPRCPFPKNNTLIVPDLREWASEVSCVHHVNAIIGNHTSYLKK